jgi:hypothetical protein
MTKQLRIENADTSNHKVIVEVWNTQANGPDVLVHSYELSYPTQMATQTIWKEQYLVIKEV